MTRRMLAFVTLVVCGAVLTACGGRPLTGLRAAIDIASDQFPRTAAQQLDLGSSLPPPAQLQRELDALGTATLSADERATVEIAESWLAAYRSADALLTSVTAVDDRIARESGTIAQNRTLQVFRAVDDRDEFVDDIDTVIQDAMKDAVCSEARDLLDAEADDVAEGEVPAYEPLATLDTLIASVRIQSGMEELGWADVANGVDLIAAASDTVEQATAIVDGIQDIVEAPNGELRAANVVFFQLCVV